MWNIHIPHYTEYLKALSDNIIQYLKLEFYFSKCNSLFPFNAFIYRITASVVTARVKIYARGK